MHMAEPLEQVVAVSGININLFHWPGPPPVVLFLHGAGGNGLWWAATAATIGGRFEVYAPDMPGHGKSDRPAGGYSIAQVADDIGSLIETLHLERPVLVAHSYAGKAAMLWAAHRPERVGAMVLVDPTPPDSFSLPAEIFEASLQPFLLEFGPHASMAEAERVAKTLPQYRGWNGHLETAFRRSMVERPDGSVAARTTPSVVREIAAECMAADVTRLLPETKTRTLLLTSAETEVVLGHGKRISSGLEHCTWKVLRGNHWLFTDAREEFHEALSDFLSALG